MDSRIFIEEAKDLIADIKSFNNTHLERDQEIIQSRMIQSRLDSTLGKLYNPTLPSAHRLVAAAVHVGFNIDPKLVDWVRSH